METKTTYTYEDTEAGLQTKNWEKLSELISEIEEFGYHGEDSDGVIYSVTSGVYLPVFEYRSRENGIMWIKTGLEPEDLD